MGWRWGFSRVVATFSHVGGSFNFLMATTGGVLIIPSFRIRGYLLHVEHISCHHELRPTSVGHPFFFLNTSWGFTGGKHYQNITITLLSLYCFLSLSFPLIFSGWFVTAVCGSVSVMELIKYLESLQTDVELPSTKWVSSLFVFLFLVHFFLKLIVACILCYLYEGR